MPAQQGVWLNDDEGLFPRPNEPGQQDEEQAIRFREGWPFHLPLENGQLVSQEGIFCHELGFASAKIGQGGQRQGGHERFGPKSQARGEHIQAAILQPLERGKNTCHNKSSPSHESVGVRA
jgi:hypothetical protein